MASGRFRRLRMARGRAEAVSWFGAWRESHLIAISRRRRDMQPVDLILQ
jgi:hypothetical protein